MSKKKGKKDKQKVVYYDDNSTIADMSNVTRIGKKHADPPPQKQYRHRSTFREKWKTYWSAVKMMLLPMFMVLLVIAILYLIIRVTT